MQNSSNLNSVVVALGNPLKGDDAIGIEIGKLIEKKIKVIFAFTSPDAYISKIKKLNPKFVFFLDAAIFNGEVGEVKLIKSPFNFEKSTHAIDFTFIESLLKPINVRYIGVNVESISYGEEISTKLKEKLTKIAENVEELIFGVLNNQI